MAPSTITGAAISVNSLGPGSTIRLTVISDESGQTYKDVHEVVISDKDDPELLSSTFRELLKSLPKAPYKCHLNYSLYFPEQERATVLEALQDSVHISAEMDNESAYFSSLRPWSDHPWQNDLILDVGRAYATARISVSEVEEGILERNTVAERTIGNDQKQLDAENIMAQLINPVLTELQATPSTNLHSAVVIASSSTVAPGVVDQLRSKLPGVPVYRVTQSELAQAVAQRALELAKQAPANLSTHFVFNVAPLRVGVAKADGFVHTLIPRHFTLPNRRSCILTTSSDNQTTATIKIVAGESPRVDGNASIAELVLKGIAPRPKGVPRIRITIDVQHLGETEVIAEVVPEHDGDFVHKAIVQLKDIIGDMTTKEIKQYTAENSGEVDDVAEAEQASLLWAGNDVQGELPQ